MFRDGEVVFLAVPWGCLRFVIVVFPDHTHLLFLVGLTSAVLHTKSQGHQPSDSREEDFKGFYDIWTWRPSW